MTLSQTDLQTITGGFLAALRANALYVAPSATFSATSAAASPLSMADAVALQREFVELRSTIDKVAGYKSAANAAALQTALGLSEPIVGALFAGGERASGARIDRAAYRTLLIETELGFVLGKAIQTRLTSVDELREAVTSCVPMIELADPGFGRTRFNGLDLIAANSASAGFIRGTPQQAAQVEVNDISIRLSHGTTTLHEAQSRDLMGDQWQALLWLVNKVIDTGYQIHPGQLFMTGALGGAHPAAPGEYLAQFGPLGEVSFSVF